MIMASPRFPEPPAATPPTSIAECDRLLGGLAAKKGEWTRLPIPERIQLLEKSIDATISIAPQWVAAAARAKGIDPSSQRTGEEWLGGPMTLTRNLRLMAESLRKGGQPKPAGMKRRDDGQYVAQVFPNNIFDKLMFTGFTAEVWIEPGKEASQGRIYREMMTGTPDPGRVSLVLGAGNVASIGPMDAIYKLYAENEVVIVKTNPVNSYLGPFWEAAMKPFVDAGFIAFVHGGAEVGQHLCNHPLVETIHMTGSDRTYDAIVWGSTPEQQAANKAAGTPVNTRHVSAELGCVTPVLIVPGPWSDSDIDFQARHVAAMVTNNASFNCNAAKVLVTAKGWPLREKFVDRVHQVLAGMPSRKAYYPGAEQRYQGFISNYPQSKPLSEKGAGMVPWTVIPGVKASSAEYALTNEAFCGVLAEVELDATTAGEFLTRATDFANDECWGSLSTMMLIHPKSQKEAAREFDHCVANLRYGGIGVNVWAGVIYGLVVTTWGAFPGHPPEDIRSGCGVVHNTFLFDHPQKSVIRAPFRINPTPAWFSDHKTQALLGERLTKFEGHPGWGNLPAVVAAAFRG
jgi:acyl-CoA reductase-like NAD-dependent aldehyde dehydrogenase